VYSFLLKIELAGTLPLTTTTHLLLLLLLLLLKDHLHLSTFDAPCHIACHTSPFTLHTLPLIATTILGEQGRLCAIWAI